MAAVGAAPLWDFDRALKFCRAAEALNYEWVEEPLAMDDYDGLAKLCREAKVDVTGGELNSSGLPEFGVMLEKGCYDVYQPDAVFTGGIADTWKIIQKIKAAPRAACTTWRALYAGLRTFRQDLMAHIHTENNILFERFAPAQVH